VFETKELKFDVEQILNMKNALHEGAADLINKKNAVLSSLTTLEKDWDTEAGRVFLEKIDTDWAAEVDNYLKIVTGVDSLLGEAYKYYKELEEEIDNIKFY